MGRYLLRRLLQFVPTIVGTMFLLHYMMSLAIQMNGNPARAFFGDRTPSQTELDNIARSFGTDDPCLDRTGDPCLGLFVERSTNMLQGDFGTSFRGFPVTDLLGRALPFTIRLMIIAVVFEAVVGLIAGVLAGLRNGSFTDYLVKVSTVFLVAIPTFVLGVVLQDALGVRLHNWLVDHDAPGWLTSMFNVAYTNEHPWASLMMPGIVLGAVALATTARLTRTSLMENLRGDYVRTAKAKGLRPRRVVGVHTLRNSLIPVVTNLALDIGGLMGGAVVTEGIFNIPGIGGLVFRSVRFGEAPVVVVVVSILVIVYLLANLIVDVLYAVLDPRIRYD